MVILENRKYAQITFYCGTELFKASYISKQLFNALYAAFESCVHGALKVAPLLFSESEPEAIIPSHTAGACHWRVLRKTLKCWIRRCMNLTTVPIILTVGRADKAFSSGPVNGGVQSQLLTHIQTKRIPVQPNRLAVILSLTCSDKKLEWLVNDFILFRSLYIVI